MSKYVENNLGKGEEVVLKAKKSFWAIVPRVIAVVVWVALFIVAKIALAKVEELPELVSEIVGYAILAFLAISVIKLLIKILVISCQVLVVTNKRVLGKVGVLSIKALDYPIEKVDNVSLKAGFFGNIFSFYTLSVKSGNEDVEIKFEGISNANKFKNEVTAALERHQEEARKAQAEEIAKAMAAANASK